MSIENFKKGLVATILYLDEKYKKCPEMVDCKAKKIAYDLIDENKLKTITGNYLVDTINMQTDIIDKIGWWRKLINHFKLP